ncbi:hypothetical protein CHS0354_017245 [Potamilus streckersoni]|uniref:DZIP3-like HEPN domain-containing protein n=1 Tax=Potamilus streckersoni TaxID=2493646 RepID=A0AAE0VLB4_9BIVA|nr:hypothetical protein CHS0354_017245 [Potamilus streckersoni]
MVSMIAPSDYAKQLHQNNDTVKTSTLCFKSKNNFINVGVFHCLLATCLSKWTPAKKGTTYRFFRGFCVFDLDVIHQLLLSLNGYVIQATVIRWTKQGRIPDIQLCKAIRDVLYIALSEISEYLCPGSELQIWIKCKESAPLTNDGMHSISTLRIEDEEDRQQNVGSKILRKILLRYISDLNSTLDQYMQMNKSDILRLQNQRVLTQTQVDFLFPKSGQADINEYDITLVSPLLKNIILDQQELKFVKDLLELRNELEHRSSTDMSEDYFQAKLTKIKSTLTDLSKFCNDSKFEETVKKQILDIEQSGVCEIVSKVVAIRKELAKALKIIEELETLDTKSICVVDTCNLFGYNS